MKEFCECATVWNDVLEISFAEDDGNVCGKEGKVPCHVDSAAFFCEC